MLPEVIGMITSNTIAATALLFSLATQRRENRRDHERHNDKRKQQASHMLASTSAKRSEVDPNYVRLGWVIINHSNQPFYDVTASAPGTDAVATWDLIAPGSIVRHNVVHVSVAEHQNIPAPTIEFLDCAGRRWKRHPTGMLQQAEALDWGPPEEPLEVNTPDWVTDEFRPPSPLRRPPASYRRSGTPMVPIAAVLVIAVTVIVLILTHR